MQTMTWFSTRDNMKYPQCTLYFRQMKWVERVANTSPTHAVKAHSSNHYLDTVVQNLWIWSYGWALWKKKKNIQALALVPSTTGMHAVTYTHNCIVRIQMHMPKGSWTEPFKIITCTCLYHYLLCQLSNSEVRCFQITL